jgi:DAK2 domain fusion protein YloV
VIFSQLVRGFAEGLDGADEVDARALARAFRSASDAADRAVRNPVEGTILTVARELAEEAETPGTGDLTTVQLLRRLVGRGEAAVARTPELLDVLRAANVVDAGGAGLLEVVRGLTAGVAGEPVPTAERPAPELSVEAIHQEPSRYRYCTTFVIEGSGLDADVLAVDLERLGDSLLVVGDSTALKVHVHTDEPGAALALGTRAGVVEGVEIANMHRQTARREERLTAAAAAPVADVALVAVAAGEGNRLAFAGAGPATVIDGGRTMNPSTAEIVDAIAAAPGAEVIVLPNNANVLMSAEQAVALAGKPARVVPTRSLQEGLAAIGVYLPTLTAAENESRMRAAVENAATGEVTRASRDVALDGVAVREGAWLGLANGRAIVSGDDFESVAIAVVDHLLDDGKTIVVLVTGEEEPVLSGLLERVTSRDDVEVVEQHGGQPHYPLLVLAE